MKRIFIIFGSFLLLMSCGGNDSSAPTTTEKKEAEAPAEKTDPEVQKGLELISKSDCFTCHKLTEASIGPAYSAVAAKYKTLNQTTIDSIAAQIKRGGSGKWGTVPMTPHPQIPKEDAEAMAHYIMSIK
jgi:cytochrome c